MENSEAMTSTHPSSMQPAAQAEPMAEQMDNESYWDFGYDSEKYILPGKFMDYTDDQDVVTITMREVGVSGPVRDLDVMVVAARAFITVRALKLGTAEASVQKESEGNTSGAGTQLGLGHLAADQRVGAEHTVEDVPFHQLVHDCREATYPLDLSKADCDKAEVYLRAMCQQYLQDIM